MQPQNENKVEPSVIVVTVFSISINGDRLGFGSGYYDRYISKKARERILQWLESIFTEI